MHHHTWFIFSYLGEKNKNPTVNQIRTVWEMKLELGTDSLSDGEPASLVSFLEMI